MKFKIQRYTDPKDLPEDFFSSLVGWTNIYSCAIRKNKVCMENTPGPFHTDTPAPNEPIPFTDLINEKTGKTFKSEYSDHSKELNEIEKLFIQIMGGKS